MNMQNEERHIEIDRLVSLYLSGKIDNRSLGELHQWCKESPENTLYVRNQIEIWFSSGVAGSERSFNKEEAFQRFQKRMQEAGQKEDKKVKEEIVNNTLNNTGSFVNNHGIISNIIKTPIWKTIYRVAAIILIIFLPLIGYWGGVETIKQGFSDIVVEAPLGARTKLYLPDGTMVWLNAGSKITYSQGFGVDDRHLNLDGEGYFEVTKNKDIPFEISTNELDLEVLGTKFNFRNYSDDEEVVVNLMEGKVKLHNTLKDSEYMYLLPDEKAVLSKSTGDMIKSKMKAEKSNLWTKDELYFDEALLEDIAKQLQRAFGVKIEVADSLKDRRFYGSFSITGNTIEEVLGTISSTNRMNYKYEDNRYKIY